MKIEFSSTDFSKNTQISNFMKIHPVWAELFRGDGMADGQTDRLTHMTKVIFASRNFANGPKQLNIKVSVS